MTRRVQLVHEKNTDSRVISFWVTITDPGPGDDRTYYDVTHEKDIFAFAEAHGVKDINVGTLARLAQRDNANADFVQIAATLAGILNNNAYVDHGVCVDLDTARAFLALALVDSRRAVMYLNDALKQQGD